MKTFSAQELEDHLLDYLYDELDADEKAAFEAGLPSAPAIVAEIEAHRGTRVAMSRLRAPVSGGLSPSAMTALFAAADASAAATASATLAAAAKTAPVVAPKTIAVQSAAQGVSGGIAAWFKRFGQSLSSALMTPAFATAAVALLVTGVAVVMAQKGEYPGEDTSARGQLMNEVAPVAVAEAPEPPPSPIAAAPAAPADTPTAADEAPTPAETEVAEAKPFAAAEGAGGALRASLQDKLEQPVAKAKTAAPKPTAAKGGFAPEPAPDVQKASGRASGATDGKVAEKKVATVLDGLADDARYAARGDGRDDAVTVPSNTGQYQQAAKADSEPAVRVDRQRETQSRRAEASPAPSAPRPSTGASPAREMAEEADVAGTRDQDLYRGRGAEDAEEAAKVAKIKALWERYEREYAAGQFAEATRTLREIEVLGGDANRIRTARARVQNEQDRRALDAKRAIPQPATKDASH